MTRAPLLLAAVLAAFVVGCDASPGPRPSSSAAVTEGSPRPSAAVTASEVAQATASALPTESAMPSPIPTPAALVLGGTWLSPKADTTLTSYATTLSARPTASGSGVTTFTKVVFSATGAGATTTVVCTATEPSPGGAWTCRADLLARAVPPGPVSFSFDVYGLGVSVARSPSGPRRVTYAVPPPRPTNARWEEIQTATPSSGGVIRTYRVRWAAPAGYADEFLVYETWECPRFSKPNNETACFVAGTPVDHSRLELLAKVAGDARSVEVRLPDAECGPSHGSILLRARNAYGNSTLAIVDVLPVVWPNPGEIIC